jgi:hypothetical protein
MQQAIRPAEVDEGAEVGQVLDRPRAPLADADFLQERLALAVFLLAGLYWRSLWILPLFRGEAGLSDYLAITYGGVSDWCVTPAYVFLIPTYASLWLAGRWYAQRHHDAWRTLVPLALALLVSTSVAFLISNGSFYLFSGRFPEMNWVEYASRVTQYYPPYLGFTVLYTGAVLGVHALLNARQALTTREVPSR